MNTNLTLALVLILVSAGSAFAADKKKPAPAPPKVDEAVITILKTYDKNSDFEIDRDELRAMQTDLKANPRGPLVQFDLGKDGTLDDVVDRAGMNLKLGRAKMAGGATTPPKK